MDKIPTMAKFQFDLHTSPVPIIYIYIYIYKVAVLDVAGFFKSLEMGVRGFTPGKIFSNHALHIAGKGYHA